MGAKESFTSKPIIGTNSVYLLWQSNYPLNKMDTCKIIDFNHLLPLDKTVTLNITLMDKITLKLSILKYQTLKVKYLLLAGC